MSYIKIKGQGESTFHDIFNDFGVMLLRGCYEALLTPPAPKDYITNESRLQHGTQYTIPSGTTRTKQREVHLPAVLKGANYDDYLAKYEAFLELLTSGNVQLKVLRLQRIFKLVYTGISKFEFRSQKEATFTLEFVEPDITSREVISEDNA